MNKLAQYIYEQQKRGYTTEQLKTHLIRYGYRPQDIEYSLKSIQHYQYQQNAQNTYIQKPIEIHHKHSINSWVVATLVIFMLAFLGGFFYTINFFVGSQDEKLLDLETVPVQRTVNPGDKLEFISEISNLGGDKRYDVILRHMIVDINGDIQDIKEETVAIETKGSIRSSILVPELKEGNYFLRTSAQYESSNAISSFMFKISQHAVLTTSTTMTSSTLIGSSTTTTMVEETCDDGKQNQDEEGIDCGGVCDACEVSQMDITRRLKNVTYEGDKLGLCMEMADTDSMDNCMGKLARSEEVVDYCEMIVNTEQRDDCYMWFVTIDEFYIGENFICDLFENRDYRDSCIASKKIFD